MLCFCLVCFNVVCYNVVWSGMAPTALHFLYLCALSNLETGLGYCSWWPEGGRLAPLWWDLLDFGALLILYLALYHSSLILAAYIHKLHYGVGS